jgi:hypothetical protein
MTDKEKGGKIINSKLSSKPAYFSNAGLIIHVEINVNNYLPNAENTIMRGLPNTLW